MIDVVGFDGDRPAAPGAIEQADVVCGGARLVALVGKPSIPLEAGLLQALDAIASEVGAGRRVCVVASGDPGWFGIVRALAARFGRDALRVHPAPSSVSLAFARLGLPWDDAMVVSAHGRPLDDAATAAACAAKVAVLTSPVATPAALGGALVALGATFDHAAVASRLGSRDESVTCTDLTGLAAGAWDPLSVVALWHGDGVSAEKSLAFGRPEAAFAHRGAMITKADVRAIVLAKLALPAPADPPPVMWDVGAGSGSIGVECAALAPWMHVIAIDRSAAAVADVRRNAQCFGVGIRAVEGDAPGCFDGLPDPDRVFVGGGGAHLVDAAKGRLRPGGVVVATFAALDRAAAAADVLGNLTQVSIGRGERLPDGGWRLAGANPVFVVWGTA